MAADGWFAVRELGPGLHLVAEPVHVNCFLVQGQQRAVLIDSGLGIGNIRRVAESLTDRELLVVNTHYHFDHVGGNHLFPEVAIHERGVAPLGQEVPAEVMRLYLRYLEEMLERFALYRELDERFFHFLTEETTPRQLPPDFDPAGWRIVPSVPTRVLREGDVLDLGGRRLRVLHTPGHTPDCICLLDEANGLLFGGDTISSGPIYAHLEDSDLQDFARSTARLAELADGVRRVYVQHYLRYESDGALLHEHAAGFRALLAGDAAVRRTRDCFDLPVKEALFARFSIFFP